MPRGKQCSPKTLSKIEVHLENGLSEREVAQAVGVSRGVIQNVIRRLQDGSSDYKRRSGRSRKTTTRTDRHIEFAALRDRQVTLRELQADLTVVTGQPLSHSLISRRLSEKGLNARRPRKKPLLTDEHRRVRRQWAANHRDWREDDWTRVLFTDESKISIGNYGCTYVWRRQGEELSPECCLSTVQHPASVMLWGFMASSGVGSIHKIEGKLNATGYQEILADKMLPDAYILIGEDFILSTRRRPHPHCVYDERMASG